jgi:hypothetical protein
MAGQVWLLDSLGGYFANPPLSAKLRHAAQPLIRFRQFCDFKEEFGKGKSENFNFDKVSNISKPGGPLVETETIPENRVFIYQGTELELFRNMGTAFRLLVKLTLSLNLISETRFRERSGMIWLRLSIVRLRLSLMPAKFVQFM